MTGALRFEVLITPNATWETVLAGASAAVPWRATSPRTRSPTWWAG